MAFPNMATPREQTIGRHCDISFKDKSTNIFEAARYREWESRISVGREISSPHSLLGAGAWHETANLRCAIGPPARHDVRYGSCVDGALARTF
jgi:hypothetical protein